MNGERFSVLCDVDGVLVRGSEAVPGAARFVARLQRSERRHLYLSNSAEHGPAGLSARLRRLGIGVKPSELYTGVEAVASFVARDGSRKPRVYLIGGRALRAAFEARGAALVEKNAEFVVVAGGGRYGTAELDKAIGFVHRGAKFVAANLEDAGLSASGPCAGCGALTAPIEKATGRAPYCVGKPNHLMIRAAEKRIGLEPRRTIMIGDRVESDIDVGFQAEMKTALVLSGATTRAELARSPLVPDYVFNSVASIRLEKLP